MTLHSIGTDRSILPTQNCRLFTLTDLPLVSGRSSLRGMPSTCDSGIFVMLHPRVQSLHIKNLHSASLGWVPLSTRLYISVRMKPRLQKFETLIWESRNIAGIAFAAIKGGFLCFLEHRSRQTNVPGHRLQRDHSRFPVGTGCSSTRPAQGTEQCFKGIYVLHRSLPVRDTV